MQHIKSRRHAKLRSARSQQAEGAPGSWCSTPCAGPNDAAAVPCGCCPLHHVAEMKSESQWTAEGICLQSCLDLQEQYQQLNEEPSDVDSEFDQEFASWELNEEVELDDDPLYFVQAQQRPGADIHGAARVGDVERARSASSALNMHARMTPRLTGVCAAVQVPDRRRRHRCEPQVSLGDQN